MTVNVPWLPMPPPPLPPAKPAELFSKAESETVTVPVLSLSMPPPKAAELLSMTESMTVNVPQLSMPPPLRRRRGFGGRVVVDGGVGDGQRAAVENAATVVSVETAARHGEADKCRIGTAIDRQDAEIGRFRGAAAGHGQARRPRALDVHQRRWCCSGPAGPS